MSKSKKEAKAVAARIANVISAQNSFGIPKSVTMPILPPMPYFPTPPLPSANIINMMVDMEKNIREDARVTANLRSEGFDLPSASPETTKAIFDLIVDRQISIDRALGRKAC